MTDAHQRAVIFDLDGVITDTAEYHYLGWQRLADEEGVPFDRAANEALRGLSRSESLATILGERQVPESTFAEMLERKNRYYVSRLEDLGPDDALPGAIALVVEARRRGFRVGIGSSSKNARRVLERLELTGLFDAIADGATVEHAKPAPDLFLAAAELLGVSPDRSIVIEDAGSGVDAARAAGMVAVGIGPSDRVGHAHHRFAAVSDVDLEQVVPSDERPYGGGTIRDGWIVVDREAAPAVVPVLGERRPIGNGRLLDCVSALPAADAVAALPAVPAAGVLLLEDASEERELDLRHGRWHRRRRSTATAVSRLVVDRFLSLDRPDLLVQRHRVEASPGARIPFVSGPQPREDGGWPAPAVARGDDEVVTLRWEPAPQRPAAGAAWTQTISGGTWHRQDSSPPATIRGELEVGEAGVAIVDQIMAVGVGHAIESPHLVAAATEAARTGHDVLLARHATAWERVWRDDDDGDDAADEVTATERRCRTYLEVIGAPGQASVERR